MEGVFTREDGDHVIWTSEDTALLVTNELRYLNWSPNPNAEVDPDTLEVRALRPIAPGEEVTIDYGAEWDRSEKELAADRIHSGFVVALARGLGQRLVDALQVVR